MAQNPFSFGNPIRDPSLFFGRNQEIRQIVNRLSSTGHESSAISSGGRMGSTSLLLYLQNPLAFQELGLDRASYCFVYLDFQGTDLTPTRFWKRVLSTTSRSLADPKLAEATKQLASSETIDIFDLEDHLEILKDSGLTIVLLLDEFENLVVNPGLPYEFFENLRTLAVHYGVVLIPATHKDIGEVFTAIPTKGSPFYNIFSNISLMPFPADEAGRMVDKYLACGEIPFSSADKEFILRLGGGHPYLLQVSGYHWYEARTQGLEGELLINRAGQNIYEQVGTHFRDMCASLSKAGRETLMNLLSKTGPGTSVGAFIVSDFPSQTVLTSLLKQGLLMMTGDEISFISPVFVQFLRNHPLMPSAPGLEKLSPHPIAEERSLNQNYDAFISYSTIDKETADIILEGLEKLNIHCWMAPRDIKPGTSYGQAIISAITECKVMIVLFSSNSNASDQVIQEVERAVSRHLTIIPVRIDKIIPSGAMELFLSSRQWLDMLEPPYDPKLSDLGKTIRSINKVNVEEK